MPVLSNAKKYVRDGYVVPDYVIEVTVEPIRVYTMYGKEARVWPFPPNWSTPVSESLEWKTDILRAFSGGEQRRGLRAVPRRSFEFGMLLTGQQASLLEAYLWGWQHKHFALPVWTDRTTLLADVESGSTTLPLNTDLLGFRAGDYALIYDNTRRFEVVKVSAVSQSALDIDGLTDWDWAAGTHVYPLLLTHMRETVSPTRHTGSTVAVSSVSFQGSGDTAYPNLPSANAPVMYDGYEVITAAPNWRDPIQNDFTRVFDTVDAEVGPIGYYTTEKAPRITRSLVWALTSREAIVAFRGLAARLQGQLKTAWVPSWHDDFIVASSNADDRTRLRIQGAWFAELVGADASRNRIAVILPGGTTLYRKILSAAPDYLDDTAVLQLDSTLGTTVNVGDNTRVRLLLLCRLATDKIVIPWLTNSVAEPQTAFTTVKL